MNRLTSLNVLLDTTPPEPRDRTPLLLPLSPGEHAVSSKPMNTHLSYVFTKDRKTLDEQQRLGCVYRFTQKIDTYRAVAIKVFDVLADSPPAIEEEQARALATVWLGQKFGRKSWLQGSAFEEVKTQMIDEAMALNTEAFDNSRRQAASIALENNSFWVGRLENSRGFYVVDMLRRVVSDAMPQVIEV